MRFDLVKCFSPVWNRTWFLHSIRAAVGAGTSFFVARLFSMPEAYWAPITTLIVMQSTVGASWYVSRQRIIGTALGATLGALLADQFAPGVTVFVAAILTLGLVCALLRLDQSAYRFANVTVAIVLLVAHKDAAWRIGIHRFFEVCLGIAVGLALAAVWPGRELPKKDQGPRGEVQTASRVELPAGGD